jgi:hypothetical protein
LVDCSYPSIVDNGQLVLGIIVPSTLVPGPIKDWSAGQFLELEHEVSHQALTLLDMSRQADYIITLCERYFSTFHQSLPVINRDDFNRQLQSKSFTSHFLALLLSVILMAHLSSRTTDRGAKHIELFRTLKNIYSLLQSTGKISIELIQAGLLVASYEHCQALSQDAWLLIGACSRMGEVLDLRQTITSHMPPDEFSSDSFETRRCLWWGIVVLERYV